MTQDKLAHLFAGGFIAAALLPFGTVPALVTVAVAAVGKEIADATPDWVDALATVAGGAGMAGWLAWM